MSDALSKTLARISSSNNNLLLNSYFEHLDFPRVGANTNGIISGGRYVPSLEAELFLDAPGWFTYGTPEWGTFSRPNNYDYATIDNPFVSGNVVSGGVLGERVQTPADGQVFGNGLVIEQETGREYGIVQPILRGGVLSRAKKVRISGCYQILSNDGGSGVGSDVAGLHIYLKKDLKKVSITTTTEDSGTALDRIDADTVEETGQNFLTSAAVGDTLVIETVGYFRVTNVVSNERLDVEPAMGAWTGPKNWRLLRPTSALARTDGHGHRVVMPANARFVAHMAPDDSDFSHTNDNSSLTGTEQLIRAWDYLSEGPGGGLTHYRHLQLGNRQAVPGSNPGEGFRNLSAMSDLDIWYLDSDISSTGSDGDILYSSELSNGGVDTPTTDLIYFDEIVTLGSSTNSDNHGEYFLVVTPVAPANVAAINTSVIVVLWALHFSIMDSEEEGNSNIISRFASARRNGPLDSGGFPAKYLASYPIYVPRVHPLKTRFLDAKSGNTGVPVYRAVGTTSVNPQPPQFTFSTNPATGGDEFFIADQDTLPPGTCIVGAGVWVETKSGTWSTTMDLSIIEVFHPPPYDIDNRVGNPTYLTSNDSLGRLVGQSRINDAVTVQTVYPLNEIYRNRMGLWDGGANGELVVDLAETDYARMGASSIYLAMDTPAYSAPSGTIITLRDGWLRTVYDPRWQATSTHWD